MITLGQTLQGGPPAHREQAHNWPLSSTDREQNPPPPPLTGLILLSPCSSATCWWVGIPPHPQWKWREEVQPAPATSLDMLHSVLPNAFLFPLQQPCQTVELVISPNAPFLTFEFLLDLIWFFSPQFCFLGQCGCLPAGELFFCCQKDSKWGFLLTADRRRKKAHSLIQFGFSIMNESTAWTQDLWEVTRDGLVGSAGLT